MSNHSIMRNLITLAVIALMLPPHLCAQIPRERLLENQCEAESLSQLIERLENIQLQTVEECSVAQIVLTVMCRRECSAKEEDVVKEQMAKMGRKWAQYPTSNLILKHARDEVVKIASEISSLIDDRRSLEADLRRNANGTNQMLAVWCPPIPFSVRVAHLSPQAYTDIIDNLLPLPRTSLPYKIDDYFATNVSFAVDQSYISYLADYTRVEIVAGSVSILKMLVGNVDRSREWGQNILDLRGIRDIIVIRGERGMWKYYLKPQYKSKAITYMSDWFKE